MGKSSWAQTSDSLYTTLTILDHLLHGDLTSAEIKRNLLMSQPTLMRHIATARNLGADIESYKAAGGPWQYRLKNGAVIEKRLRAWLSAEEASSQFAYQGTLLKGVNHASHQ